MGLQASLKETCIVQRIIKKINKNVCYNATISSLDQHLNNELLFLPEDRTPVIPIHFVGEKLNQPDFAFPPGPLNSLLQHVGLPA